MASAPGLDARSGAFKALLLFLPARDPNSLSERAASELAGKHSTAVTSIFGLGTEPDCKTATTMSAPSPDATGKFRLVERASGAKIGDLEHR